MFFVRFIIKANNIFFYKVLLSFLTICFLISCKNTDKESDETNLQLISNIIEHPCNIYLDETMIFGTWFVIEINGKVQTTALHSFTDNPNVRIYDTVQSGVRYEFDEQNKFYDDRFGVYGIWAIENNRLTTEIILPIHKVDSIVGSQKIIINYNVEMIDTNYAKFLYEDIFTGEKMIVVAVRWDKELFEIIQKNNFSDIVSFFEIPENKHFLDRRYENNLTVLMYALDSGRDDVALFLIENSVDVNAKNVFDMTALHYACRSDKAEYFLNVIKSLLEKGAEVNSRDILGQTPLDYTLYDHGAFNDTVKEIQLLLIKHGGQFGNSAREQYSKHEVSTN